MRLNNELKNEFVAIYTEFEFVQTQADFFKQKNHPNFRSLNIELIERFDGYKIRLEYMMSQTDVKERINCSLNK